MGDHFQVEVAALDQAATQLGGDPKTAGSISDSTKDADVATKSWGLLGLSLGLYEHYTSVRNTADGSIGRISGFLEDAQSAVQASASSYRQADQSGSTSLHGAGTTR